MKTTYLSKRWGTGLLMRLVVEYCENTYVVQYSTNSKKEVDYRKSRERSYDDIIASYRNDKFKDAGSCDVGERRECFRALPMELKNYIIDDAWSIKGIRSGQIYDDGVGTVFVKNVLGIGEIECSHRTPEEPDLDSYTIMYSPQSVTTGKLLVDNVEYLYHSGHKILVGMKTLQNTVWMFNVDKEERVRETFVDLDKKEKKRDGLKEAGYLHGYVERQGEIINDLWKEV